MDEQSVRCGAAATCLLGLRVQILLGPGRLSLVSVVFSDGVTRVRLINRLEESQV